MFFKTTLSAIALTLGLASMASATCIAGACPTPVGTTTNTYAPLPLERNWVSRIDFNGGFASSVDAIGSGIGGQVESLSNTSEMNELTSLGSVMIDPNCRANCGEQTLTSKWKTTGMTENYVTARSHGLGTSAAPISARASSGSLIAFEGFMGAQSQAGTPPIAPIPLPAGN